MYVYMIVLKHGRKYIPNCGFKKKKSRMLLPKLTTDSKGQLSILISITLSLALTNIAQHLPPKIVPFSISLTSTLYYSCPRSQPPF